MESPNTSSKAIEFNTSCSGQAQPNRPGTGPGYETTEPGYILAVFRVPSIICPLTIADAKSGKVI